MSTEHQDRFFRHSFIVLVLTNIGSVMNLLFHVVMGRLLCKAEYGIMTSVLGVFLIFATPMLALQNTMAHFTKRFIDNLSPYLIFRLAGIWLKRVSFLGVALVLAALFFRDPLAAWLNLDTTEPVIIVAFMIALSLILPIFLGLFQGRQHFVKMCVVGNAWAVVRLAGGGLIVYFFASTAIAALGSHLAGLFISLFMAVGFVYGTRARATENEIPEPVNADSYFFFSVIGLLLFSVLMNGDIVLVKAYFPDPGDFGAYNRASTIARTLIFLSQPLAIALFPKVATSGPSTAKHAVILLKGVALSALFIGAILALCFFWPQLPVQALYGTEAASDARTLSLVRRVTIAMAPTGITQILIYYEMAQKRFAFIIPLVLCVTGMMYGYAQWHTTLNQSITVLAAVSYSAILMIFYVAIGALIKKHNQQV